MTMILYVTPYTLLPLIIYNLVGIGHLGGGGPGVWEHVLLTLGLPSGSLALTNGEILLLVGLVVLFTEIVKSTRTSAPSIIDHGASMVVFIIYLIEFIVVSYCASGTFLLLMLMSLIDVVAGFTITIRASRRDYSIERDV